MGCDDTWTVTEARREVKVLFARVLTGAHSSGTWNCYRQRTQAGKVTRGPEQLGCLGQGKVHAALGSERR